MGSIPITRSILYNYLVQGKLYYIHSVRLANSKAKNKANIVEIQGGSVMFKAKILPPIFGSSRECVKDTTPPWFDFFTIIEFN